MNHSVGFLFSSQPDPISYTMLYYLKWVCQKKYYKDFNWIELCIRLILLAYWKILMYFLFFLQSSSLMSTGGDLGTGLTTNRLVCHDWYANIFIVMKCCSICCANYWQRDARILMDSQPLIIFKFECQLSGNNFWVVWLAVGELHHSDWIRDVFMDMGTYMRFYDHFADWLLLAGIWVLLHWMAP